MAFYLIRNDYNLIRNELYQNYSSLPNFWDAFWTKKDRCIELYYESNEYNITYCHGEIYKILGEIPNEILEVQQLFYDIGESSDYESLIAYLETKKEKVGVCKMPLGCSNHSRGVHFLR